MKRSLILFGLIFFSLGCNSSDSGNNSGGHSSGGAAVSSCKDSLLTGTWRSMSTPESIVFNEDCSFVSVYCGSKGQVPNITNTSGDGVVTVNQSSNSRCLQVGSHSCIFEIDTTGIPAVLGFNCGGNIGVYKKQLSVAPVTWPAS